MKQREDAWDKVEGKARQNPMVSYDMKNAVHNISTVT